MNGFAWGEKKPAYRDCKSICNDRRGATLYSFYYLQLMVRFN